MPKSEKFKRLLKTVRRQYLGKEVPKVYRSQYGLQYDEDEIEKIAFAIVKKLGMRT